MVKAIDFAVRTSAGSVVRGAVAGEGGSEFLQIGSGESVSLNLSSSGVLGYARQGNDLVLNLTDGRQIVLSNYFDVNGGEENRLYLSSNGEVYEVYLTDGGEGVLYANYGPADTWNKYSTVDDLRFTGDNTLEVAQLADDDTVGMAPFVPGLLAIGGGGAGAAAAVAGGAGLVGLAGGGGGGGGGHTPAKVNQPDSSSNLTTKTPNPAISVTGTGHPGDEIKVVIGDKTQTTIIKDNGTWDVSFTGTNIPGDGSYEAVVTAKGDGYGPVTLDGPSVVIDMTPPAVSTTAGTQSSGHIENLVDYQNGVTIAGKGEAGADIKVVIGSHTHTTTVGTNGNWTVTFSQTEVQAGEYTIPATITATDRMGNETVITETLVVDTVPHPIAFNAVAGDNVINGSEAAATVTVTGSSTAGAVVTVKLDGVEKQVTTAANGTWSASYPAGTFQAGEYSRTLTATTVDAAGNSSSTNHTVRIDTTTSVSFSTAPMTADNVINNAEAGQGVYMTGSAPADTASVLVEWNGVTIPATALNGQWEVRFPASSVTNTSGISTATVTLTDTAGNTASATRQITVDRGTYANFDANQAGGDNVISGTEANAGVTLTGNAEAGAQLQVEFQGHTRTITVPSDGKWRANFTSTEITRGTYSDTATVTARDAYGNTDTSTHTIKVDTEVRDFARSTLSTGSDNILNEAEAQQGLQVTGTVEAGSSVMVNFGNAGPFQAVVSGTTWSITVPKTAIPAGENSVQLTAVATDQYGNISAPHSEMVAVDRIVTPFGRSGGTIGGDGILNAREVSQGLTLNGTGEPNSDVTVRLSNGSEQVVHVGANGTWSTTFVASKLPIGDTTMQVTISAKDFAGNTSSFTETVKVDTVAPNSPNVTNIIKSTSGTEGLNGVFLDENIDNTFSFHRVGTNGTQSQINLKTGSVGTDFARFDGTTVPEGDYLVINHTDNVGNSSATLLVTNNTGSSNLSLNNTAFKSFDFSTLDLTLASTNLTISAADLTAITGPGNVLRVKGGADDQVTLQNATANGQQTVDGEVFNVYTLGSNGATLLLDDDIQPLI